MEILSTVYVINKKRQFLMIYNKKQGAWLPPGGFIEVGEGIFEAGVRETKEEAGKMIGSSLTFLGYVAFQNAKLDERTIIYPTPIFVALQILTNGKVAENHMFLARAENDEIKDMGFEAGWFYKEEVMELETFTNVKIQIEYIDENLDKFQEFPMVKPRSKNEPKIDDIRSF